MFINNFDNDIQQKILQKSGLILFSWNRKDDSVTLNNALKNFFPHHAHHINFKTSLDFYKQLHRDDRKKIHAFLKSTDTEYWNQDIDVRFILKSGEYLWLRLNFLNLQRPDNHIVFGSIQNITRDKQDYIKTAYTAYTDDLTGLLNRSRMKQKIALALGAATEYNINSVFLMIGIDNLTAINNMFGHHIADDVIQAVGGLLASVKRKSDLIARVSAGKFGILLTDVKTKNIAEIGERFLSAIREKHFLTRSGEIFVTASGGGCFIPHDANTIDAVLAISDECLAVAKKRGRNTFTVYKHDPEKQIERETNIKLSGKIIKSIHEHRVCPAFQPIINPKNPEKSFFEMLARIKNHDGEIIPAYKFIPIAENTGFIRMIDMHILDTALNILNDTPDVQLSVNLSGHTLSNTTLAYEIIHKVNQYAHVANRLIIEITETVALQDIFGMQQFMQDLHNAGFRIALDDFGAGYNSFSNLKLYPFDVVKIDGIYVRDIHKDTKSQIFVKTLSEMSQSLGLEIVAEMISDPQELTILQEYPIDYYQGFMFGKPELDLNLAKTDMLKSLAVLNNPDNVNKKTA